MEKYTKVPKQKEETEIEEKEIRVTTQGKPRNFISYATSLFKEKGATEVVLKAMGRAISKTVTIAEIIKRRIPGLHQITVIDSTDITDIWEPKEEGLDRLETTRHVSSITITLSTEPLDTSAPGYQAPIPAEQVKDFSFGTARKGTRRQFVGGQQFVRRDNFQNNYGGGNFQKNFGGRPAMNRGGPRQIGGGGRRGFDRGLREDFQSDRPFRGGRRGMTGPAQGQMGGVGRRFNTQGGQAQGGQFQGQGQYQGGQFQGHQGGQMLRQGPRRGNFNQGDHGNTRGRMQGGPRRQFHQGGQFQGQGGQFQGHQGGQFQGHQGGQFQAQGSSAQGGQFQAQRGRRNFHFQGRFGGGPQVGRRRFAGNRGPRRLPEAEEVLDGDVEEGLEAGEEEEYGEEDD